MQTSVSKRFFEENLNFDLGEIYDMHRVSESLLKNFLLFGGEQK